MNTHLSSKYVTANSQMHIYFLTGLYYSAAYEWMQSDNYLYTIIRSLHEKHQHEEYQQGYYSCEKYPCKKDPRKKHYKQ